MRPKLCNKVVTIMLLAAVLSFSAEKVQSSVSSKDNEIRSLESKLLRIEFGESTLDESKLFANRLADIYLAEGFHQDAIWTLRRGGDPSRAEVLEKDILRIMTSQNGFGVDNSGELENEAKRISGGVIRSIGKGISTVNKFSDLQWKNSPRYEVAAYRLDQLIGLNRVPLTILAHHELGHEYSIQLMIKESTSSNINFRDNLYSEPDLKQRTPYVEDIFIFDYLLGQADRHSENSLISKYGRLVLIDNARSFSERIEHVFNSDVSTSYRTFEEIYSDSSHRSRKISPKLYEGLSRLTSEILYFELGDLLSSKQIELLVLRVQRVVDDYNSSQSFARSAKKGNYQFNKCHAIFSP